MTHYFKFTGIVILLSVSNLFFAQSTFNYQKDFKKILCRTQNSKDDFTYQKLRNRFLKNEKVMTDYEVLALLIGYTASPDYKPYDNLASQKNIYDLNVAGKFEESIVLNRIFLEQHPYNLRGHIEMAYAFQNLNELDSSECYAYRAQRIQNAMLFTGDGKTKNSAMFALSTADGKDFILTYLKAGIGTKGSATDNDGNFLDVIQVMNNGQIGEYYYFNIQHASRTVFGGKSLEKNMKKKR